MGKRIDYKKKANCVEVKETGNELCLADRMKDQMDMYC